VAAELPPGWTVVREQYTRHMRTTYGRDSHGRATATDRFAHPWLWTLTEPDGTQRTFDTRREAVAFAREYEGLPTH
jgi:hypothetical protein